MKEEIKNYCTFYLVRHGESEGNAKKVVQGSLDTALTEKGKIQIKELKGKLKDVIFDAAYSSDLFRAKQTAEILIEERELAIQTSELIRERNYGAYEGKPSEEYDIKLKEARNSIKNLVNLLGKNPHDLLGVENNDKLVERAILFLREVAVANLNRTILVVSHGALLRTFLNHTGFLEEKLHPGAVTNGSYIKVLCDGTDFIIKETQGINTSQ